MKSPFSDLSTVQRNDLYELLDAHRYSYNEGDEILQKLKYENIVCIILSGYAQQLYIEYSGNEIIIEDLYQDSVFGTNISAINSDTCQIVAKEPTEVLVIDYKKILNPENIKHKFYNIFITNLFDIINNKIKDRNERIKILEKKQIRDKLLEYFEIQYRRTHTTTIYPPPLKDLADYLAINRSAMFRELSHLKEDKLIQIRDKKIILLYKSAGGIIQ